MDLVTMVMAYDITDIHMFTMAEKKDLQKQRLNPQPMLKLTHGCSMDMVMDTMAIILDTMAILMVTIGVKIVSDGMKWILIFSNFDDYAFFMKISTSSTKVCVTHK